MNDFEKYVNSNENGRLIDKPWHYFEIYERHLSRFRGREVHILEIGVSQGGSLDMWRSYFGDSCKIYGVDNNPHCKSFEREGVKIFIGDQKNRKFLRSLAREIPRIDILIDDGGHIMKEQKNTFNELYRYVSDDGVYICEDLFTSYYLPWGGSYRLPTTFVEFSKRKIDSLNAWWVRRWYALPFSLFLKVSDFSRSTDSIHFYTTMVVFEKRQHSPEGPTFISTTGKPSIPNRRHWIIRGLHRLGLMNKLKLYESTPDRVGRDEW